MTIFDIIIILVVAGFVLNGLRRGFFHEILGLFGTLGGLMAGVWGASSISRTLAEFLPDFLGKSIVLYLLSFSILLVAFFFITRMLAKFLRNMMENLFLGWLNNAMGGLLGSLKGMMMIGLVFMYTSFLPFGKAIEDNSKDSLFYEPLSNFIPTLYEYIGEPGDLPAEIRKIFEKSKEQIIDDSFQEIEREYR